MGSGSALDRFFRSVDLSRYGILHGREDGLRSGLADPAGAMSAGSVASTFATAPSRPGPGAFDSARPIDGTTGWIGRIHVVADVSFTHDETGYSDSFRRFAKEWLRVLGWDSLRSALGSEWENDCRPQLMSVSTWRRYVQYRACIAEHGIMLSGSLLRFSTIWGMMLLRTAAASVQRGSIPGGCAGKAPTQMCPVLSS